MHNAFDKKNNREESKRDDLILIVSGNIRKR